MYIKKELEDYKGYYVDTLGNVFKGEELVPLRKQSNGYIRVSLRTNTGRYKQEFAHRLVAIAFLNLNCAPKHGVNKGVVDHINGIKDDNRLENLEVVTIKENNNRRYKLRGVPARLPKE